MGAQLKRADRLGARYAVFVGAEELAAGRFGLKDLRSGEQVPVDGDTLVERLGGRSN
jgi:histidyl-tRNA synthetase